MEDEWPTHSAPRAPRKQVNGIIIALLVAGLACLAYSASLFTSVANRESLARFALQVWNGEIAWRDIGPTLSLKSAGALSEFEALQQGRLPTSQGSRCRDAFLGGCSGNVVTAEACRSDATLRERCCRSCHELTCIDQDTHCEEWAYAGECIDNPDWMKANCCSSCSPDPDDPCSVDPSSRPDVYKGDIGKIFTRLIAEHPQYAPTVHSRDPWLVSFDNVLTDEECAGLVEAVGGRNGEFIRPSTTAKPVRQANGQVVLTDVPDQIRTSHNAWCQHRSCYEHPVHEAVIQRMMGMVGLPPNNAEHMQLLRYGPNEYYRLHHDWIPEQLDAACGPRVFTFFLYLSDVEEGGGTYFPHLNVTVRPKKGTAVLWPHGLDTNPRIKDRRTHHEAQPVLKGVKYAANYWIHGRDFKRAMASRCDGRQGQPKRSRLLKQAGARVKADEEARGRGA